MPQRNNNLANPNANYKYSGKELDEESLGPNHNLDWYYFGARYYDPEIGMFRTPDPMAHLRPSLNPYHYVQNNPMNRIDPDGMKDKKFNPETDKAIDWNIAKRGATRLILGYDQNHRKIYNPNAFNCHSYAWHMSKGDPTDIRNKYFGKSKWDNYPDDDIEEQGYYQLGDDESNMAGDRVVYFIDYNDDGILDNSDEILHSAVVSEIDDEGNTTKVKGKMGEYGVVENHPRAPDYYPEHTNRAYMRKTQEDDEILDPVIIGGE